MFCQHVESTSGSNTSPVLLSIIMSSSITMFFWSLYQASFLNVSSINFWSHTFLSMTFCYGSLSKHLIEMGVSAPKIISLYFVMVSLMAFSSSSFAFIQFWRVMFNSFAFFSNNILFICYYFVTLGQVKKSFLPPVYNSKNQSSSS